MNQTLFPTDTAGVFMLPNGEKVQLLKYREDDFYDTGFKAAGAITAGSKVELFKNQTGKGLQHTNLTTPRRITSDTEMIINRIGVLPAQAFGNELAKGGDIVKCAYAGVLTFKIGRERIVSEGPLVKYPTGLGVTGSTTESESSYLSVGVPSSAATPSLLVPQKITDKDDIFFDINFPDIESSFSATANLPTLEATLAWMGMLHGLITDPMR